MGPLDLPNGARAFDRLFQLEKGHGAILEAQPTEIQMPKDRLAALKHPQGT